MSCSHLLILNRHVFLNTSDCRRAKYSCEWILCGTDIKLWTLLQYGEQADGAARRCNKPQSQRSISHQLVVRKAFLLTSHPENQTVQSGRSQSRISFPGGVQKVLWQMWVSGPSSADTTGGHRDIKQLREKRRSITSDNCSQNFFFFSSAPHGFSWTCKTNICFILRRTHETHKQRECESASYQIIQLWIRWK